MLVWVHGTLKDWYRASDLEPYTGGIVDVNLEDYQKKTIGMTEASKLQSAATGSLEKIKAMCQCSTACYEDNRCSCYKDGLKCTSHCHGKLITGKIKKTKVVKKCKNDKTPIKKTLINKAPGKPRIKKN